LRHTSTTPTPTTTTPSNATTSVFGVFSGHASFDGFSNHLFFAHAFFNHCRRCPLRLPALVTRPATTTTTTRRPLKLVIAVAATAAAATTASVIVRHHRGHGKLTVATAVHKHGFRKHCRAPLFLATFKRHRHRHSSRSPLSSTTTTTTAIAPNNTAVAWQLPPIATTATSTTATSYLEPHAKLVARS
jgi:hypothetical protein